MPAAIKNLLIEQGATFQWTLLFPVNAKQPNGPKLDLTGYTARMHVRPEIASATILIDLTSSVVSIAGGILITPLAGRMDIEISDVLTSALSFEKAVYDLELVQPDGKVLRIFKGSVSLSLEVTRP
jgi:hypothetical protein